MITVKNLKAALSCMGFEDNGTLFNKSFPAFGCSLAADFACSKLIYPEAIKGRDRNDSFDAPENFVVFECVNRLLEKGYRPEDIELEKEWHLGHNAKGGRADICVSYNGKMLFIIECKTAGKEFDKAYKDTLSDGGQLFSYWQQEQATKWLVLYASDISVTGITYKAPTINCADDPNIVALAKNDNNIRLYTAAHTAEERFAVWKETYACLVHDNLVFSPDTKAYEIGIRPLRKKDLRDFSPEDRIVNRFEEILRHNNVSDKENAFNRLVALFICKLVDEITKADDDVVEFQYIQGTDTYESLQDRLQKLHTEGMQKFMREKMFYVPSDYPEKLFERYNSHQRKKAIEDLRNTIRVLKFYSNNDFSFKDVHNEELFYQNGKILVEVVQLFERYRIVYPSKHQFLGDLFEQLLNKGFKQNEGQFFTPMPITRFIWDSLPIQDTVHTEKGFSYPKVIDYACGAGHFLTEAVEAINAFAAAGGNNDWVRDHIFGIEKDYRLARVSKISMFMNGAGEANIVFGDGLENQPDKGIENGIFDILVANPPYSVKDFKQHLQLKSNTFELLDRIGDNGSEIEVLFVERIAQLLKPNGIAAVILPSSILSNDSASYTGAREQLLQNFKIRAIVQFGSKTFGATGTNTVVLFLKKYDEPPKRKDMISDSVSAILAGKASPEWEDNEVLEAYTAQINVAQEEYVSFATEALTLTELSNIEHFKMYVDAFMASTELFKLKKAKAFLRMSDAEQEEEKKRRFYAFAKNIEQEKLFYFALAFRQNTLVITAPADNAKQKEFLGYDWSNRKGNEGIQIIAPGGKMYNDADRAAEGTLACAIRQSCAGTLSAISEENSKYASMISTVDMLNYSRVGFNKVLRTSVNSIPSITSKFEMRYAGKVFALEYGKALPENARNDGNYPVMGSNGKVGTHNEYLVPGPAIIVGRKGSAGSVTWEDNNCYPIDTTYYVRLLTNEVLLQYIYYLLGQMDFSSLTNKMGVPGLNRENVYGLKIPVPPIPIQQQIIDECAKIDDEYDTTRISIEEYRKKISEIFDELEVVARSTGVLGGMTALRDLVAFNPSKSELRDMDDSITISFVEMASVSNHGYIESIVERSLGELRSGSYTYFAENDIIIAKITPCMENGKCAVATGLSNGVAFGSSEFHVLRCNDGILSKFVFGFLNREKIRQEAAKQMTGSSGHRRVPISFYESLQIPVFPTAEQEKVVSKVEGLEAEIAVAERRLKELEAKRADALKKFLI